MMGCSSPNTLHRRSFNRLFSERHESLKRVMSTYGYFVID